MADATYLSRRDEIEAYFDRTALDAWSRLTSDAPVGRIRATVRAGRERMRETLLSFLPADLTGFRLLDAGCGTGALALAAARRGAEVVAVDLSPSLVRLAGERATSGIGRGRVDFRVGDMLDPALGRFDVVVAMDSLIHYAAADAVRALAGLAARADRQLLFTFAPKTPALAAMHAVGRLFPRRDRAPAIEPIAPAALARLIAAEPAVAAFARRGSARIAAGFYTAQAEELVRR